MATLKVSIHEARDLPVMDRATGLADPYVVVSLNAESYTTEIDSGTCNPIWNKDVRFDAAHLLTLQEDPLEFRVYDHDIVTRDDLIGLLYIDLNCILGRDVPSLSGWFPLYDTMAGLRGELRVTIKVKFHAAENPAAPRLPSRVVQVLPTTLSGPPQSSVTAMSGSPPTPLRAEGSELLPNVLLPLSSPAIQYQLDPEEYHPLVCVRSHQPSLTTEEEGVHIFSMPRLDPSLFRVEGMLSMVEELIVKADPEHSKFTTIRSSRATNEARLLQLYKLSGKVRRQLARKVLELQCNGVLGYEEKYDLEPNGIIVRAYGTPCVISAVKFAVVEPNANAPLRTLQPPAMQALPPTSQTPFSSDATALATSGRQSASDRQPADDPAAAGFQALTPYPTADYMFDATTSMIAGDSVMSGVYGAAAAPSKLPPLDPDEKVLPAVSAVAPGILSTATGGVGTNALATTATRSQIITLTVTDVPSGVLYHVGGLVSAKSVKLVSKLKSKLSISQERDVWWSELREEVKYNARALHCNAIIAYEEVAVYDHEDVVVLSISGTAVVLDSSWLSMRCGPEHLYHRLHHRIVCGKSCSILHLYQGHAGHHSSTRRDDAHAVGPLGFVCSVCRKKPVPEVLLASCMVPLDLMVDGPSVLIQAAVAKTKPNVKGAELAMCLSQAIPFLEFSLHKQLMFKLQLERMSAAFGVKVSFAIGSDVVVATLTATAFRVHGLPIPQAPKLEFWEADRMDPDIISRLQEAADKAKGAHRKTRRRLTGTASLLGLSQLRYRKTPTKTDSVLGRSAVLATSPGDIPCEVVDPAHAVAVNGESSSTASECNHSGSDSEGTSMTHNTWLSSSSSESDNEEDDFRFAAGRNKSDVAECVVNVDDDEESELLVSMVTGDPTDTSTVRLDDVVLTVSYLPMESHYFSSFQHLLTLSRRYSARNASNGSPIEFTTLFFNKCLANARLCFLTHLRRIAFRQRLLLRDDVRVFQFKLHCVFEPNSNDLHVVMSGLVCGAHPSGSKDRKALLQWCSRAFDESESLLLQCRPAAMWGNTTTSTVAMLRSVAEDFVCVSSDEVQHMLGSQSCLDPLLLAASAVQGDAAGSSAPSPSAQLRHPLGPALTSRNHARNQRAARKIVFLQSNAPFALPYVFRRDASVPAHVDPFALLDARAPLDNGGVATDAKVTDRLAVAEQTRRTGMVKRQLHALTNLASATLRNFADKMGMSTEGRPDKALSSPLSLPAVAFHGGAKPNVSGRGGGRQRNAPSAVQQLLQPCSRVPADRAALMTFDDSILLTPLPFVPGAGIARYMGRISQHFIREAYEVYSAEELGAFYAHTDVEVHGVVRAFVRSLGGNALLSHTLQIHEVWDSDGSGCAFLCLTVSGHVALVSREALAPPDGGTEVITSLAS